MQDFNTKRLTLHQYLEQDVFIPNTESVREKAEQLLKDRMKRSDNEALFERMGHEPFDLQVKVFKFENHDDLMQFNSVAEDHL